MSMEIKELNNKEIIDSNKKIIDAFNQFNKLLAALRKRDIPKEIITTINIQIDKINGVSNSDKELRKQIQSSQTDIIRLLEKKLKLVAKKIL